MVYDRMVEMVAPAPGRMPLKNPISPPRMMGPIERRHSSRVSIREPLRRMISVLPKDLRRSRNSRARPFDEDAELMFSVLR